MNKFLLSLLLASVGSSQLAAEQEVIEIAGWGGNDKAVMHNLLGTVLKDELDALNVDVKYQPIESNYNQYIVNSLSAGTAPDIFYVDVSMVDVFASTGKISAIEDDTLSSDFLPVLNKAFTVDGKQYALPKDFNSLAVVYNTDVFDDAGVAYPTEQDSTADLRQKLAKVVSALGDEGVYGVCLSPDFSRFAPFLFATGWQPFDASFKTSIDTDFAHAFRFFTQLFEDELAITPSTLGHSWSGGCFGSERTAIAVEGNWLIKYLNDKAPNLQFGAVMTPFFEESQQRGNLLFTVGWAINDDGNNTALAKRVASLLAGKDAQAWVLTAGLALPSRVEMQDMLQADGESLAKTLYQTTQQQNVYPFSFSPYGQSWSDPISEGLSSVIDGNTPIDVALKKIQDRYDYMYENVVKRQ